MNAPGRLTQPGHGIHPPYKVLIADDDDDLRTALAARLVQAGFHVVTAADGKSATEVLDRSEPDAAVLDIEMPGLDGLGVCEYLRSKGNDIPVFFLTGSDRGVIRKHLATLTETVGGDRFITKPYDGKLIAMLLRDAIRDRQSASA